MEAENLPGQTPTAQLPKPGTKGSAVASIVLGIVTVTLPLYLLVGLANAPHAGGILGFFGPLLILAVIAGLIGLILGVTSLKSTKRSLALTGVIIGVITLLFEFLSFFLFAPRSMVS